MSCAAVVVALPFFNDPYIDVLALALIVLLAAILMPSFPNTLNIQWTKGMRTACIGVVFVLAAIGTAGERGWLQPPPIPHASVDQPCEPTAENEGPCTTEKLDPQGYYNIGKAWNDLQKYDRAITFFKCSESAIFKLSDHDQEAGRETHAFLILDWGNAERGKALGSKQREDWCAAKDKFQQAQKLFDVDPIRNKSEVLKALPTLQANLVEAQQACK